MKINVTCINCQRLMSVDQEHVGKKGKCPACGAVNLLQPDGHPSGGGPQSDLFEEEVPFADISSGGPGFGSPANPYQRSDPQFPGGSPYQAPIHGGAPQPVYHGAETDVFGILGVVLGGLSLVGLCLCVCFGPIAVVVVLSSIAGLVLSLFGKPPLKVIGICLNASVLGISLVSIIGLVAFWIFAMNV